MTQGLWVVNSSLLVVFGLAAFVGSLVQQEPPVLRLSRIVAEEYKPEEREDAPATTKTWEKIYLRDIFDTYVKTTEKRIIKKSFVTPIPEPRVPAIIPPPEIKTVDFVAPLSISLKGLIVSAEEHKSIAMIADETGKEHIYHIGDSIKDAQLIKIAQNRAVFIRANGQHETFYLRVDNLVKDPEARWTALIKKNDDQHYEVDPQTFGQEVESLGYFLERFSIIGTAFKDGNPVGIRIGGCIPGELADRFGLKDGDIITKINGIETSDADSRVKIFDAVCASKLGDVVSVTLLRAGHEVVIAYTLAKRDKFKPAVLPPGVTQAEPGKEPAKPEDALKKSKLQQREHKIREFKKQHAPKHNKETLAEIRKRLLGNLQSRLQNARVR